MPRSRKASTAGVISTDTLSLSGDNAVHAEAERMDTALKERLDLIEKTGLSPGSALDLLGALMTQVPGASKEAMDRIKTVDKLMNTARAMMETKLKNEEVVHLMERLDALEQQLEGLTREDALKRLYEPVEIRSRNAARDEGL